MPPADRLVLVGRVLGAFGVRGELRVRSYAERPLALLDYRAMLRGDGSAAVTLTSGRAARPGEIVARAVEVGDRDAAEALRGLDLYVPRDALPEPETGDDFYLADLIGLAAVSPQGERQGVVKAVLNHGASDILEIAPEHGGATWLVPFTRENVPEVRVDSGEIVVTPPAEVDDQAFETTESRRPRDVRRGADQAAARTSREDEGGV